MCGLKLHYNTMVLFYIPMQCFIWYITSDCEVNMVEPYNNVTLQGDITLLYNNVRCYTNKKVS